MILIRLLDLLMYLVIARVLVSWLAPGSRHPAVAWIARLTDPLLAPLSRHLTFGGVDVSPMILIVGIQVVQRLLARAL